MRLLAIVSALTISFGAFAQGQTQQGQNQQQPPQQGQGQQGQGQGQTPETPQTPELPEGAFHATCKGEGVDLNFSSSSLVGTPILDYKHTQGAATETITHDSAQKLKLYPVRGGVGLFVQFALANGRQGYLTTAFKAVSQAEPQAAFATRVVTYNLFDADESGLPFTQTALSCQVDYIVP